MNLGPVNSQAISSPYHVGYLRLFSISGHGPQPLIYPHFQARLDLSSMFIIIWFPTNMETAFFLRGIPRHSHPSKAYQCSSSRRSPHYRPPPPRNAPLQSRCFQISKPCRSPAKWMVQEYQEYKQQGLVMAGDCIDCWAWLELMKWYRNYSLYSSDLKNRPMTGLHLPTAPCNKLIHIKYTRQRITHVKKHEEPWRTRWSCHSNSFHHDPSPSSPWSFWSCSKSLWTANCQWTVASNTRSPPSRTDLPSEQWSNHAGDHRENYI